MNMASIITKIINITPAMFQACQLPKKYQWVNVDFPKITSHYSKNEETWQY